MKIKVTSNFGRFATEASVDVDDNLTNVIGLPLVQLLKSGLENELFRRAASAGYKALVASGVPKKTPRAEIEFTTARAELIAKAMNEAVNGKDSKLPLITFAVTGEHIYGGTDREASKEAVELWTKIQGLPAEQFAAVMAKLGLDVEEYDDESAVKAVHASILEDKRAAAAAEKAKRAAKFGVSF